MPTQQNIGGRVDRFSKEERRQIMMKIRSQDSKIELLLHKTLWQRGFRYKRNCKRIFGKPDFAFISLQIAVFCDSEFWHGFDWVNKKREIKSRQEFWYPKIERNIARDIEVTSALRKSGWIVLRFWEKEITQNMEKCVQKIEWAVSYKKTMIKKLGKKSLRSMDEKEIKLLDSKVKSLAVDANLRQLWQPLTLAAQSALMFRGTPFQEDHSKDAPFQVVDFFSGCGGMSLGFAAVSLIFPFFRVVGGIDISSESAASFRQNFNCSGIVEDIHNLVDRPKALRSLMGRIQELDRNKKLILVGCAPCQGFTSHRKKSWHKDDGRNTLVGAFASIAAKLRPEAIVMENVPEMLSAKYWKHFQEAKRIFQENGYIVKQSIYNAAAFGVAQERFRSLVIAMKKDFILPEDIYETSQYCNVREAIGYLPRVEPGTPHPNDSMHRCAKHNSVTLATIKAIPKDGGNRPSGIGPKCLDKVRGFYDVYGRLFWDKPAITITHYSRNPASGRFSHPEQDRGLTAREAALLQSFPYDFEILGSFDGIFRQIGEAVPPLFSTAVAAKLLVELLSPTPTALEIENSRKTIVEPVSSSFSSVIAGIKAARRNGGIHIR
jgi:DNA (cytosine-5)-methyltransferase 1